MRTPDKDDGVSVPKTLAYSTELGTTAPLHLLNHSKNTFVFKIRTNQKNALSLHSSHGFLRAHSQLEVIVKIIDKPNPAIPLKLEVNYALATHEDIEGNDSKRAINAKQQMTKRVIVLRQGRQMSTSGKGMEPVEKAVSVEEQSALDSSIKKEDSENYFQTAELTLFPIIRTPKKDAELGSNPNEQSVSGLFKHTFSLDHEGSTHLPAPPLSERETKMELFGAVFAGRDVETPSAPPSQREAFNPFEVLVQTVKNQSDITIDLKQDDESDEHEYEHGPQSPILISAPSAQTFNPFAFLAHGARQHSQSPQKLQELPLSNSQHASLRISYLTKRPMVDSKILEDDQFKGAKEREIEELSIRIECLEGFIKDLEKIPVPVIDKLYPKWIFILLSLLAFIFGGIAKHFLF